MPPPTLNYLGPFEWSAALIPGATVAATNPSVDKYGRLYSSGRSFDRTGALAWDGLDDNALIAAINTWYGSALITAIPDPNNYISAQPILGGTYLLANFATANMFNFNQWWVVIEVPPPASFNHLVVQGVIRYETLLGVPYTHWFSTMVMNAQTVSDPILILGNANIGAFVEFFALIPSVADMMSRTYAGGWGGAFNQPFQIPYAVYDLSPGIHGDALNLFFANPEDTEDGLGVGDGAAFSMPGPGGSTNIYQYLSRARMDFERRGGTGGFAFCPEIKNVIEPAFPLGQMIKINIPNTNFATAMGTAVSNNIPASGDGLLIADLGYTLDGTHWGIPWTDEWTYLSNGQPGGQDSYMCTVSYHGQLPSGEWFIAFIMPGADDADVNFSFPVFTDYKRLQLKAVRGFIYDPNTGLITTAYPRIKGISYTHQDISLPINYAAFKNEFEILDPIQTGPESYDMHMYGSTLNGSPAWRTRLHLLSGRPWVQVNS